MTVTQTAQELHVARVTLSKALNGQAGKVRLADIRPLRRAA